MTTAFASLFFPFSPPLVWAFSSPQSVAVVIALLSSLISHTVAPPRAPCKFFSLHCPPHPLLHHCVDKPRSLAYHLHRSQRDSDPTVLAPVRPKSNGRAHHPSSPWPPLGAPSLSYRAGRNRPVSSRSRLPYRPSGGKHPARAAAKWAKAKSSSSACQAACGKHLEAEIERTRNQAVSQ
jgi:hypothetical protein